MSVELFGVHVKHQSNAFLKTLITTAYNNDERAAESERERKKDFSVELNSSQNSLNVFVFERILFTLNSQTTPSNVELYSTERSIVSVVKVLGRESTSKMNDLIL